MSAIFTSLMSEDISSTEESSVIEIVGSPSNTSERSMGGVVALEVFGVRGASIFNDTCAELWSKMNFPRYWKNYWRGLPSTRIYNALQANKTRE